MTKEILFKKGDAGEVSRWRSLLISKMEKMNCGYTFFKKENFNFYRAETAHMNITDPTFQRVPVIEIGYEIDRADNALLAPTLLHEMGHVVDYQEYGYSLTMYWRALGTLEMETRAWENAFKLAKELGYKDLKTMRSLALKCLGNYFENTSFIERADKAYKFTGVAPSRSEAMERLYKASM